MPADRWTLAAGGGRLGPAVLFWSLLLVVLLASIALGRIGSTPLGTIQWSLLGVGLTQAPIWVAAIVAGWLLALGWRLRSGAALGDNRFNLVQVGLALWTAAALAGLFVSIERGLLGLPEMQISGNGSTAQALHWYHDRAGARPAADLGDLGSARGLPTGDARVGAVDRVGTALVAALGLRRVRDGRALACFGARLEAVAARPRRRLPTRRRS